MEKYETTNSTSTTCSGPSVVPSSVIVEARRLAPDLRGPGGQVRLQPFGTQAAIARFRPLVPGTVSPGGPPV